MRRISLVSLLWIAAAPAFAHPSVVPHDHPHGTQLSLDAILVFVLLAALTVLIAAKVRRRQGPP
jgi:hypothetical protein